MLPLGFGFNDLADSPTIVLSPHQHQFDPISSRAAHSIYYHQPRKPLMPTRYWDHPGKIFASRLLRLCTSLLLFQEFRDINWHLDVSLGLLFDLLAR